VRDVVKNTTRGDEPTNGIWTGGGGGLRGFGSLLAVSGAAIDRMLIDVKIAAARC
jgi:hypothetical protein